MEPVGTTWTNERLDDLNGRVDELGRRVDNGFNRVDEDLRALRVETRTEIGMLRGEINARIDAMQRTMIQFGGGMIIALLGLIVTVALQR
jgi:hypothetical protein